ncbi:MAG: hypothetical protein KTR21_07120 [Rhodobacteraceae bacterium]|nr:hypothetical protein [Paracoccaceae bacterium]
MKILLVKAALGAFSVAVVALTLNTAPALSLNGYGDQPQGPVATLSQRLGHIVGGLLQFR